MYVAGALLDPITGVLALCGLAIAILGWRDWRLRLPLVWFVLGFILIALTSHLPVPTLTRQLYVLPPTMLLAAIGLIAIWRSLRGSNGVDGKAKMIPAVLLAILLVTVSGLNLNRLLEESPPRIRENQNHARMIIKLLEKNPDWHLIHIRGRPPETNILEIMEMYPWYAGRYSQINIADGRMPSPSIGATTVVYVIHDDDVDGVTFARSRITPGFEILQLKEPQGLARLWLVGPSGVTSPTGDRLPTRS
jgi:hypothetical protein